MASENHLDMYRAGHIFSMLLYLSFKTGRKMRRDKKGEDGVEGEGKKESGGGDASNLAVLSRDVSPKPVYCLRTTPVSIQRGEPRYLVTIKGKWGKISWTKTDGQRREPWKPWDPFQNHLSAQWSGPWPSMLALTGTKHEFYFLEPPRVLCSLSLYVRPQEVSTWSQSISKVLWLTVIVVS